MTELYNISRIKKIFLLVISLLIIAISSITIINIASAATIHGTIYDVTLSIENNAIIEVNSTPKQMFISRDGEYAFNLSTGEYLLKFRGSDGFAEENITVKDLSGDYIIDIVLEPAVEHPTTELDNLLDSNANFTEPSTAFPKESNNYSINTTLIIIIVCIILISLAVGVYRYNRAKNNRLKKNNKNIKKKLVSINKIKIDTNFKNKLAINTNKKEDNNEKVSKDNYGNNVLDIIQKEERITQKDLRKQIPLSEGKVSLIITELEHAGKIKKIKKGRGNILIFVNK